LQSHFESGGLFISKKNHNQDHTPHREAKKYVQTTKIHIWIYES
jgi:hypothetical protein